MAAKQDPCSALPSEAIERPSALEHGTVAADSVDLLVFRVIRDWARGYPQQPGFRGLFAHQRERGGSQFPGSLVSGEIGWKIITFGQRTRRRFVVPCVRSHPAAIGRATLTHEFLTRRSAFLTDCLRRNAKRWREEIHWPPDDGVKHPCGPPGRLRRASDLTVGADCARLPRRAACTPSAVTQRHSCATPGGAASQRWA